MSRSGLATLAVAAAIAGPGFADTAADRSEDKTLAAQRARGEYLVTVTGCHDCHTPLKIGPDGPRPDMSRMLSGHPESLAMTPPPALPEGPWAVTISESNTAWSGAWGVSFTANLTPDPQTGLGRWTLRNFSDTLRSGRHMGRGREILPPMPVALYKHFTDADIEAIYAYLRSIPAVRNKVPAPLPPGDAK